jgi:P27 family predicted phage terminase small subunit
MGFTGSNLPSNLNIIKSKRVKNGGAVEMPELPDWFNQPELWSKDDFLAKTQNYLLKKNGVLDLADQQLLAILASQIEVYISSLDDLKKSGLVINFNNGVTVGPNPHINIADKALNRIIQIMKELELSPKARSGYRSNYEMSPELKRFLDGPKSSP